MLTNTKAEEHMARLMKSVDDYFVAHIKDKEVVGDEVLEEHQFLMDEVHLFGEQLASYPHFFEILEAWMVDISGTGDMAEIKEYPEDFVEFIKKQGSLAAGVQQYIEDQGFEITDRGGGKGRWTLGVPCTTTNMRKLTAILHAQFARAIDAGTIRIYVRFFHWRLPTLRNMADVNRYLKKDKGDQ